MKKKLAKVLLSAALVFSILGNDFFYVGAENPQEDTTSEVTEGVTNDVVENEQENEIQAEEVQPEENIVPDTPLPEVETEDGQVDSEVTVPDSEPVIGENGEVVESEPVEGAEKEEVSEEAVATLSDEGEEEIPEITGEELLMDVGERASSSSPCVGGDCNKDQVCRGGGKTGDAGPDSPNSDDRPNRHPNNMPDQDPQTINPNSHRGYWDDTKTGIEAFKANLTEQQLITRLWPKRGSTINMWKLRDAVITPMDQCYFANQDNGYGESVHNDSKYIYHDQWWNPQGATQITPRPEGMGEPHLGKPDKPFDPNYIGYTGNYIWERRDGGKFAFTIVTRPVLEFGKQGHYQTWDPFIGHQGGWRKVGQYYIDGSSHPRVYDKTGKREWEHNINTLMYTFTEKGEGASTEPACYSRPGKNFGGTPKKAGWYEMTVQTPADQSQFILPGMWVETVIYMDKGYRAKFQKSIDNQQLSDMKDDDWQTDRKPDQFDSETKRLFGIDFYKQGTTYNIPIPKYDEAKYIFEGWRVHEEVWNSVTDRVSEVSTDLDLSNDINKAGYYEYNPRQIKDDNYFVLNARLEARLRTRKINNVNTQLNFINDQSGLQENEKATINTKMIELVEQFENKSEFSVEIKDLPFDFVGYTSDADGKQVISSDKKWKPWNQFNPEKQNELVKDTTVFATISAKPITIKLDPNGGQEKANNSDPKEIKTHYYMSPSINSNAYEKDGYVLKGWSETKDNEKTYIKNGDKYKVEAQKVGTNYPTEKILYAVWGRKTAIVHAEKHKDSLFYQTDYKDLAATGIYGNGTGEISVYELGRYYLDVELASDQSKIDPAKFYVVWERSTDNGNKWEKLNLNDVSKGAIITKPFGKNGGAFAKVMYDLEAKKYYVPLLGRMEKMNDPESYRGLYRVNIAYDDDLAAEKVTTEEDFFGNKNKNGWTTSGKNLEVKVITEASAFINVPSAITLEDRAQVDGTAGKVIEVIESVNRSNQVSVVPFEHVDSKKKDYDWVTPNNALSGANDKTYDKQHGEFVKPKDFFVGINWSGKIVDNTGKYSVEGIKIYSNQAIGNMQKDQEISQTIKSRFKYDGSNSDKVLFDFYLKGDKPKGLPEGLQLKGTITFTVSPVAQ